MREFKGEEKSLRKQWLIITVMAFLAWPLFKLGLAGSWMIKDLIKDHQILSLGIFISFALIIVLLFYVLYRCAYVKPGIRYLTFLLIIIPVQLMFNIMDIIRIGDNGVILASLLVDFGLNAWWYLLSWKLRKVNKSSLLKTV